MNNFFVKFQILLLLIFINNNNVKGQSVTNDSIIESQICNHNWKLNRKVRNSYNLPIKSDGLKNELIFFKDKKMISISHGEIDKGKWDYDNKENIINMNLESGLFLKAKIITLSNEFLIINFNLSNDNYEITLIPQ